MWDIILHERTIKPKLNEEGKMEKRRHERKRVTLWVNNYSDARRYYISRVRDISKSGMCLVVPKDIELKDRFIFVEMCVPDAEDIIWIVGEIVRYEENGALAIRFENMSPEHKMLLDRFIDKVDGYIEMMN